MWRACRGHSSEVPALLILTRKAGWLRVQISAGILAIAIVMPLVVLHDSRQKGQAVPQIRQRPRGKDYGAFIKGYAYVLKMEATRSFETSVTTYRTQNTASLPRHLNVELGFCYVSSTSEGLHFSLLQPLALNF